MKIFEKLAKLDDVIYFEIFFAINFFRIKLLLKYSAVYSCKKDRMKLYHEKPY